MRLWLGRFLFAVTARVVWECVKHKPDVRKAADEYIEFLNWK